MGDCRANSLDLNFVDGFENLEELSSIHEPGQLEEQMEDLNPVHEIGQLEEQMECLCNVEDEYVPKVGMTFMSCSEANEFYKEYAKRAGFASKIRNSQRDKETGSIKNQLFTCNREGKRKSDIPVAEKTNPWSPANCPARMFVHIDKRTKRYVVSKVVLEHSHPCSADLAEMLPQHRELSMYVRQVIMNNDQAGIRPSKTYQSLVTSAGGHYGLNFIEKDVRNYITREVRNVSEEEDAQELVKYFLRMKEKNPNFFYEFKLDKVNRLKNVLWADARSRAAYEYFGDVVSFDTTYNKNRYDMPFASFVGVNHRGQSTLLGCALMKSEDTESFK